jgi:quercetin dioxygenase-like cupin family protein
VVLGDEHLRLRDYHVAPAPCPARELRTEEGALLFLRESAARAGADTTPLTVRDADAGWPDYAPGIQRRVLWQHAGEAAMLYYAQPGAAVPLHTHGHDEECLMVQGELFLDDVLLQPGDYQLAPAGTGHRITETDTGVVIYAHGDLDLRFVA